MRIVVFIAFDILFSFFFRFLFTAPTHTLWICKCICICIFSCIWISSCVVVSVSIDEHKLIIKAVNLHHSLCELPLALAVYLCISKILATSSSQFRIQFWEKKIYKTKHHHNQFHCPPAPPPTTFFSCSFVCPRRLSSCLFLQLLPLPLLLLLFCFCCCLAHII